MKNLKKFIALILIVSLSLIMFSACNNSEKWKITSYTITDDSGTHDMTMAINSSRLELFKDGKCTLQIVDASGLQDFVGVWSEKDDVITADLKDFPMTLVKLKNKLTSTKSAIGEGGITIVTVIEFSK